MSANKTLQKINNQSIGEEITNAITHGIGAVLAIAGTAVAIVYACLHGDTLSIVSAALYGAGLIILYMSSTLYHSLTNYKAKKVFQILDHCSIYILILSSYIPISLSLLRGALGWVLFSRIYSLYLTGTDTASFLYGGLAALCLSMLWLYACMLILLSGAEINKLFFAAPPVRMKNR